VGPAAQYWSTTNPVRVVRCATMAPLPSTAPMLQMALRSRATQTPFCSPSMAIPWWPLVLFLRCRQWRLHGLFSPFVPCRVQQRKRPRNVLLHHPLRYNPPRERQPPFPHCNQRIDRPQQHQYRKGGPARPQRSIRKEAAGC
jgi:hypothetical protein